MRPAKEGIGGVYREQFESKCAACGHHSGEECSYSGMLVADIKFQVNRYFELSVPHSVAVPCPVFAELKRSYDEERRQVPVRLALERARRGIGPRVLTGKVEAWGE